MFNPLKPYNTLPYLPPKYDFDQVPILKAVNAANKALSRLNALASKLPDSSILISPLLVRESLASSKIENINTTMQEVFQMELLPEKKRTGAAKEVLHYRDAMLHGLALVRRKGFLATNDFVAIQKIMEPNKTGIRHMNVTIQNMNTKEVLYTPPEGEKLLRDLLENVEKYINLPDDGVDPLIKMAVFHYQFESIHPFLDGNGRVGRILMILYLVMSGLLDLPVLFLSGYVGKQKSEYYRLLQETRLTGDYSEIVTYFLRGVQVQAEEGVGRVEKIEKLMEASEKVIEQSMKVRSHRLTKCIFSKPLLTIDYVQEYLALSSRQTASKYLAELEKLHLLEMKQLGLNKIFYSKPFIRLLS
ncbi:MAG: Fic/DOC family N-terminal domain-containing protein [Candidatus Peribacteraceae bacterium]|nr:Fic/DOC family N-terminal domain-containing protein [Candidatus Peribacteraceae bacterium]